MPVQSAIFATAAPVYAATVDVDTEVAACTWPSVICDTADTTVVIWAGEVAEMGAMVEETGTVAIEGVLGVD